MKILISILTATYSVDWGNPTVGKIMLILTEKFSLELQITELVIRHYPTKICPRSDKILPAVNDWADQIPEDCHMKHGDLYGHTVCIPF